MRPMASNGRVVLADYAYQQLRSALIHGELEPGSRLAEVALANRFNMSRTPMREALRRLEAEHLAVRDGASLIVAPFDLDAAIELLVMRELLEPHCAETSAPHLSALELARLRALSAELEHAEDRFALAELNNDFHTVLYQRCPHPRLVREVDRLREHFVTYRLYATYTESDLGESSRDHAELAEVAERVAAGETEPEQLGALVRAHIVRAREALERNSSKLDE